MASRTQQQVVKRFGPGLKTVAGRFFPNGTSNDALTVHTDGGVASVVRNASAGVFVITFQNRYRRLIGCKLTMQHTSAADLVPQLGDVSNLGAGTTATSALVRVLAGATPTDVTANSNSSVFFEFTFQDSTMTLGDKP